MIRKMFMVTNGKNNSRPTVLNDNSCSISVQINKHEAKQKLVE